MRDGVTTATTSPDDDLDPALRTDSGADPGAGAPSDVNDPDQEHEPEHPRPRDSGDGRQYVSAEEARELRDRLARAEGIIGERRQQELQDAARAGSAAPTDPVERQYFDIFQKWLSPQLEQAGQRIGQVMTGLADRTDRAEFQVTLMRRGYDEDEQDDVLAGVDKIQKQKLAEGRYVTREDALDIYEGRRARKGRRTSTANGRRNGGADVGTRATRDQNAETQELRERAKPGAMVPTGAPAGRKVAPNEKRDEDLTVEELETKYADRWV